MSNNSIVGVLPYVHNNSWVFDDPDKGLVKEPFVMGADTMLDKIYDAYSTDDGEWQVTNLLFSKNSIPESDLVLTRTSEDPKLTQGTYWVIQGATDKLEACYNDRLWLCPALYCYFPEGAPKKLHLKLDTTSRTHPYAVPKPVQ